MTEKRKIITLGCICMQDNSYKASHCTAPQATPTNPEQHKHQGNHSSIYKASCHQSLKFISHKISS